ncbi:hypothetical protein MNBD_GAMMA01-626 [hydrothermal vent metagenome]|uniref:Lipoprotein n=1 Tax=hydrothermal vent metagenome TaxID=652676 RepID=A0A3B0V960_9ZZZZ
MKIITILTILFLLSCSDAPQQDNPDKPQPVPVKKEHALQGYQDQIQKAKDMEKEILKAAEKQRKAIDG